MAREEVLIINCGHCPCSALVEDAPGDVDDDDLVCNLDSRPAGILSVFCSRRKIPDTCPLLECDLLLTVKQQT